LSFFVVSPATTPAGVRTEVPLEVILIKYVEDVILKTPVR